VVVAITADFVFNRWDLEILPYYRIRHIPWCVRYHAQSLRLEAFEYFYVRRIIIMIIISFAISARSTIYYYYYYY
jgi:hypothetical protein